MRRGREAGHVPAGLSDDHLRDLLPDSRNGLQQLDLVRPRLAAPRRSPRRVRPGPARPAPTGAASPRQRAWSASKCAGQRLGQVAGSCAASALGQIGQPQRIRSPSIIAVSIARADTVFRLEATEENLIDESVRHEALLFEWR